MGPPAGLPRPSSRTAIDAVEAAVSTIRERTEERPRAAVVTGSGLASVVDDLDVSLELGYAGLPGFPEPSVPGHAGRLLVGHLDGTTIVAFVGRFHRYEGHAEHVPALLPLVARGLGAEVFVTTAAAGSLEPGVEPGTVVVVRDHLNLQGADPLRGWRSADGAPAFADLSRVYDAALSDAALSVAADRGTPARPGVYAAVAGPSFETPAEAANLRAAGATVVGMSVVPETVPAHASGLRVAGLVCVTNTVGASVDHADVVAVSSRTGRAIGAIVAGTLSRI